MLTICPACGSGISNLNAEYVTCPCGHRYEADSNLMLPDSPQETRTGSPTTPSMSDFVRDESGFGWL